MYSQILEFRSETSSKPFAILATSTPEDIRKSFNDAMVRRYYPELINQDTAKTEGAEGFTYNTYSIYNRYAVQVRICLGSSGSVLNSQRQATKISSVSKSQNLRVSCSPLCTIRKSKSVRGIQKIWKSTTKSIAIL